jgi:hemerythrin superfamily protein
MNAITNMLSPNATNMIRLDHAHALATFRQYRPDSRSQVKKGLVNTTCLALEVHAQLEEEIFYPALREVSDSEVVRKSVPEHDEMRRLIALLRSMEPEDPRYDETYMELMRDVMHHVADEETSLLPDAERLLADELGDLGARMTKRRFELVTPKTGELALNMARAMPASTIAVLAASAMAIAMLGSKLASRTVGQPRYSASPRAWPRRA